MRREPARSASRIMTSIGVAVAPQDGQVANELLRNADAAMYRAKVLGKNRAVRFTDERAVDRGLGCSAMQGYLFGRPMPISLFEAFTASLKAPWREPLDRGSWRQKKDGERT